MMMTSRAPFVVSGMLGGSLDIFENFESREAAGGAHDAAAGMRGRAAHVKILDGSAEARVSRCGTQEEELLEREFALEDVAFAQTPLAFEIERSYDLLVQNDVFDVGRVLGDGVNDGVAKGFFFIVPVETRAKLVGRVLHEAGEHMLAR